jgi:superfamily II DNA or RNA helicase
MERSNRILSDFLPSYPSYNRSENELFNVYDEYGYQPEMYETIRRKREFNELTLLSTEEIEEGQLLKHQQFIKRFLSAYTPYHSLLIWHEVGTGKTLTSLTVAENMKQFFKKRALILVKGRSVERTFRKEIRKHFPYYIPTVENKEATLRQINSNINESYEISTFRIFSSEIASYCNETATKQNKDKLRELYSNRVIIIDEVHNLREEKGRENVYDIIHRFLHIVENCKILLLSATPIKDSVKEFASIMNLILPMDKQFTIPTFTEEYFTKQDQLRIEKKSELIDKIKGYISYLRQSKNQAQRIDKGIIIDTIKGFSIVPLIMGSKQSIEYKNAIASDVKNYDIIDPFMEDRRIVVEQDGRQIVEDDKDTTGGIYQESRQAILACFPKITIDKNTFTYGSGKQEKVDDSKDTHPKPEHYKEIAQSMIKLEKGKQSDTEDDLLRKQLEKLESYSNKYHYIVTYLLAPENKNRKLFVYGEFIGGSGLFLLEQLLQLFDIEKCVLPLRRIYDNPFKYILYEEPKRKYAIITSQLTDSDISYLLDIFNDPLNDRGDYISVILGSKTMSESHNLKCIRDIIILTPHWNYTEIEQAIGRGIRTNSHRTLPVSDHNVTVHRLVSLLPGNIRTIDQYMYEVSYKKDVMIKQLEYVARESAIDCGFNKERNTFNSTFNNTRECFYTTCPYKCTDEEKQPREDLTDTYNLFYTDKEYKEIRQILQYQFSTSNHFSYSFEELIHIITNQVTTFPLHVILRCIIEIIQRHEPFTNSFGFKSYLKEKNNQFFLSYRILQSKEEDNYYIKQGQIYPDNNPFEYITQMEYNSMEMLLTNIKEEVKKKNYENIKRILSILPLSLSILFCKSYIEIVHEPDFLQSNHLYINEILDCAKKIDLISSNDTIRSYHDSSGTTIPPERYERTEDGFTWVAQNWNDNRIQKLIDILEEDRRIIVYGYRTNGNLYLYDLTDKSFLRNLKRSGKDCSSFNFDQLKKYYKHYNPDSKENFNEKDKLCSLIQDKLEQHKITLSDESTPISLLVDEYVHEKMREKIEKEKEKK